MKAPESTTSAGRPLPVVWVLDGADLFALTAAAVERLSRRPQITGVPPCIVVGVDRDPPDRTRRWFDATPWPSDSPEHAARAAGGADDMVDRLRGPFLEALTGIARPDLARQHLVGHSLMGLLVLHAATSRPEAFSTFAAVSPSIWWNPASLRAAVDRTPDAGQRVFVAVGEREEPPGHLGADAERRGARRMIGHARATSDALERRLGSDRVSFHLSADEDHASVLPAVLPRLLRFAFEPALAR